MTAPNLDEKTLVEKINQYYRQSKAPDYQSIPYYRLECYWKIGKHLCTHFSNIMADLTALKIALKALIKKHAALPSAIKLLEMSLLHTFFPDLNQLSPLLSWSHYLQLIQLREEGVRNYYHREAITERWTLVELKNAIANQQFYRLLATTPGKAHFAKQAQLKNYFQFGFLQQFVGQNIPEKDLETALIDQLQHFLTELGKGFAFVSRQKRLITPNGKRLFVDLLFYNYILDCFVLIDLKVVPLNHEHIGQMDTYRRLFNESCPLPDKAPCIGIILCPKIDLSLLHYSSLKDDARLMAFEYAIEPLAVQTLLDKQKRKSWEAALFKKRAKE